MQEKKEIELFFSPSLCGFGDYQYSHTHTQCYTSVEQEEGVKGGEENGERMSRDKLLPLVMGRESGRGYREKDLDITI